MATLEVGQVLLSAVEKRQLESAAATMPADWRVLLAANVTPPFVFEMRVEGPGTIVSKAFAAGEVDAAAAMIARVRRAHRVVRPV